MNKPLLIVMARTPGLGHGKQRLAREMGRVEALRIGRFLRARTLRAAFDPRWRTLIAITPDGDARGAAHIPQGAGDLGARLARVFDRRGRVAVIGTDCPDVSRALIARAFTALRAAPYAIGPAHDGGFWIFAAREARRAVPAFGRVRWSSEHACADLIAALDAPAAQLPILRDIDTAEDWRAYAQRSSAT